MRQTFKAFSLVSCAFFGGTLLGYALVNDAWSIGKDPYQELQTLSSALNTIKNNHLENIPLETLTNGAIRGMVEELDAHSKYLGPSEYNKLKDESDGWTVGIGIELNRSLSILRVHPNSPAARSGIMVGDTLIKIDDKELKNKTLHAIYKILTGEKGKRLKATIRRDGLEMTFEVVKDDVRSDVTQVVEIEPGHLYARLETFSRGAVAKLEAKIQSVDRNPSGIILDLRDNPGGLIEEGVALADLFLTEGEITTLQGRDKTVIEQFNASDKPSSLHTTKTIVLINGRSASASELCAGALKARNRAQLVGTPTYGKSSMQKVYTFDNQAAIKLTVARYVLPNGDVVSADTPLKPNIQIAGLLDDPKKELVDQIKKLDISPRMEQKMLQRLNLLHRTSKSSAIPWGDDVKARISLDPQLETAWNLLIAKD